MSVLLRRVALGAVGVVTVLTAWSMLSLLGARGDLNAARAELALARQGGGISDLAPALQAAGRDVDAALGKLRQPGPRLVALLPVVGRTPHALTAASGCAAAVLDSAGRLLDAVPDRLLVDGRVDVLALRTLQDRLADPSRQVQRCRDVVAAQRTGWTPGAVRDGLAELSDELAGTGSALDRTDQTLRALTGLLDTPDTRVLLALENNAELRATGGIVTVFAELTLRRGSFELGPFRDVEQVADPPDATRAVLTPSDYGSLYGPFKAGTTLWKNVNMSPDVPTSSAVLANVASASLGRRPDAILWFDVPLIAALLRGVGPVTLPDGSSLSGDNAVQRLLSDAYREATDTPAGQAARRAQLRAAADAVLARLLVRPGQDDAEPAGGGSLATLAGELAGAAAGRHLAVWSGKPALQQALVRAGLAGELRADGADVSALTVHNLGGGDTDGNKLDFYGRRQVTVEVALAPDRADVQQVLTLRNTAPATGLPVYVAGRITPGVENAFVTLSVPAGARGLTLSREGTPLAVDPRVEGDHRVLSDVVSVPSGSSVSWTVSYHLPVRPGKGYALSLFPQPLAVDAGLAVTVRPVGGRLSLPPASALTLLDGQATRSGPFDSTVLVRATVERPGRLARIRDAVQRFWSEPVSLP